MIKLKRKNFVLRDLPRKLNLKDYEDAINFTVSTVSNLEDVISIYQLGHIYIPGISDVDLIIVLKENPKNPLKVKKKINKCFKKYKHIFVHNFHILTEELMKDVFFMFPIFSIKRLCGKEIPIKRFKDKNLEMIIFIDLINTATSRDLMFTLLNKQPLIRNRRLRRIVKHVLPPIFPSKKEISVREFLCRISLIKYIVSMYEKIMGIKKTKWREVADKVEYLKNNWFNLGEEKYNTLINLITDCINVYFEMFEEFNTYLEKQNIFSISATEDIITYSVYYTTIYTSHWQKEKALENIKEFYNKSGQIIFPLPLIYLTQLLFFPKIRELIVNNHYKKINFKINNLAYKKVLIKRYNLLEQQVAFLNKNKFNKEGGFMFFYYPYNTSLVHNIYYKIIKNKNKNAALKILNI